MNQRKILEWDIKPSQKIVLLNSPPNGEKVTLVFKWDGRFKKGGEADAILGWDNCVYMKTSANDWAFIGRYNGGNL